MAHYAFIDENNIVVQVIVGKDETEFVEGIESWEKHYSEIHNLRCLRTSYNTRGGNHTDGKEPFRKNYAGIGYTYDEKRDAFIPPKNYPSWVLNEDTCIWEPPVPRPQFDEKPFVWDEELGKWLEVAD